MSENRKYCKVWLNGHVRFPNEKPAYGFVKNGLFNQFLDFDKNQETVTHNTKNRPEMDKVSLVQPQVIKKYRSALACVKDWIGSDKELLKKYHNQ